MTETEDRRPLKSRSHAWVQDLAQTLVAKGITPNRVSMFGVGFAVLGFCFLWGAGRWPAGGIFLIPAAICVQGRLLCNLLDGMVAIEGGQKQKGGALFNELPDRIEDTLLLAGAGHAAGYIELGWICAVLAVFTAYIRAFGASLQQGQDFGGPFAKPQRMFVLTVGILIAFVEIFLPVKIYALVAALVVIAIGTFVTACLRVNRLYSKLP